MGRGATISEAFFTEGVRPVLDQFAPGLPYLAGRLGSGSDVLGYDDKLSADHDFGCRLTILVDEAHASAVLALDDLLEKHLPQTYRGMPVRFPTSWDERNRHKVEVRTVHDFAQSRMGVSFSRPLEPLDWLCFTGQSVLEVIGGPIFQDETEQYGEIAEQLQWYPRDQWLYTLAASWSRLSQEFPFVGRTGATGDELGSRMITARLARDVTHLAFLLEQSWSPYPKWVGRALRELPTGAMVSGYLLTATSSSSWEHREAALGAVVQALADRQSELMLPIAKPAVQPFYDRPFSITNADIPLALMKEVADPSLRKLPSGVGSIEQWCDNVDLLKQPERREALQQVYRALLTDNSLKPTGSHGETCGDSLSPMFDDGGI